ncbi:MULTISPECIES: hypothetical protein [unclassified Streptomyces]|nr:MULTISPECIES: hypothetical protein [unclassified Streptomyces]
MSEITTATQRPTTSEAGLVLSRKLVNAARDRAAVTEGDGGGTGRSDGND